MLRLQDIKGLSPVVLSMCSSGASVSDARSTKNNPNSKHPLVSGISWKGKADRRPSDQECHEIGDSVVLRGGGRGQSRIFVYAV